MSKVSEGGDFDVYNSAPTPLKTKDGLHDPFGWYKEMRSQSPIHFDSQREVYDVFGFQLVKDGLQNDNLVRKSLANDSNRTSPFSYIAHVKHVVGESEDSSNDFFKSFSR